MNIGGLIQGLKQKVRDRETAKAVKVANELKSLKTERIRAEGQKKLYATRASEVSKAKKAKADLKLLKQQSTVLGRVGLQVKKNLKEKKGKKKGLSGFSNDSPNAWFPK